MKHEERWIAEMAIVDMRRKGREVSTLAPYYCDWCGWWHLGNPSEKWLERQRIMAERNASRGVRMMPWGPVHVGGGTP